MFVCLFCMSVHLSANDWFILEDYYIIWCVCVVGGLVCAFVCMFFCVYVCVCVCMQTRAYAGAFTHCVLASL